MNIGYEREGRQRCGGAGRWSGGTEDEKGKWMRRWMFPTHVVLYLHRPVLMSPPCFAGNVLIDSWSGCLRSLCIRRSSVYVHRLLFDESHIDYLLTGSRTFLHLGETLTHVSLCAYLSTRVCDYSFSSRLFSRRMTIICCTSSLKSNIFQSILLSTVRQIIFVSWGEKR